ncbi:MAG TPA: hypothetical protein VGF67_18480 [Ktedonobacteraceae bacterium]
MFVSPIHKRQNLSRHLPTGNQPDLPGAHRRQPHAWQKWPGANDREQAEDE